MTTLDRTIPPLYKTVDNLSFAWPTPVAYDIPFFVLHQKDLPLIHLTLLTGAARYNEPQHGVAYMTGKMLLEGTANHDTKQIASHIDYYGAHINVTTKPDYGTIELITLSKYFTPMLALLVELLSTSLFPIQQIAHLQKIKLQEIKVENEQNNVLAYTHYKKALLGDQHPYSYRLSAHDVTAISRDDLVNHYQAQWLPTYQILLSGKVAEEELQLVKSSLAFLQHKASTPQIQTLAIQAPTKVHIPKKGSLQSAICIGKTLFSKTHPDYAAMYVVSVLLGGYFGSRLMCNLREEKGYTYHIEATLIPLKELTYFLITTEVMQKFAAQACQEIYHEIALLQTEEVTAEELNKLKNYLIGNFLAHIHDPFYVIDKFKETQVHQLDQNFYYQLFNTIRHITPTQIQTIAKQYLALDSLTEVCVG